MLVESGNLSDEAGGGNMDCNATVIADEAGWLIGSTKAPFPFCMSLLISGVCVVMGVGVVDSAETDFSAGI